MAYCLDQTNYFIAFDKPSVVQLAGQSPDKGQTEVQPLSLGPDDLSRVLKATYGPEYFRQVALLEVAFLHYLTMMKTPALPKFPPCKIVWKNKAAKDNGV